MTSKHIIAGSTGFITNDGYNLEVGVTIRYAFELSGKTRPKFSFIGTATGDDPRKIANYYDAMSHENVDASHLQLFPLPNHKNVEEYLLSQDIIWVGGGSVANLLAVWRVHGLDVILRQAWEKGIILMGVSAGAICWSVGGTTDSFGVDLKPIIDGLGLLPFSCGVHYDSEEKRRPLFQKLIREGELPEGYATDDGVNIHYVDTEFKEALSDRQDKFAYHVYSDGNDLKEDIIKPRILSFSNE